MISKQQKEMMYVSVETALVGIVCFVIGERLSQWVHDGKGYLDGLWCMVSALVVLQSFVDDTLKASKDRVIGTLVASVLSVLVCFLFGYGYLTIFLAIALSAFTMNCLKMSDGVRIATATAAVITAYGFIKPHESPLLNASMRSLDTLIGVGVALSFVYLSFKLTVRQVAMPD
ncbi:MAG: FUSC family protein [Mariniblastus sp.]|nr:FUSC family protein [Mariniblastus sp.]